MKLVAPRPPTSLSQASGGSAHVLPTDVVDDQLTRIALFCATSGGLWSLAAVAELLLFPNATQQPRSMAGLAVSVAAAAAAAVAAGYVRSAKAPRAARADAGLGLLIVNAACIALLETWVRSPLHLTAAQPTWIVVSILLTAMILPTSPRKMTVAVLIGAAMGPLGLWAAHLRGQPTPPFDAALAIYAPGFFWGLAAVTPSIMFQRMARRVREARDLASYELLEPLGSGGMGEVWRARHRLLAREAAIKLVQTRVLGTGDQPRQMLRRFEREAQATAQLASPHTVQVFDFGETDDHRFYYAMELLVGRDLESLIGRFGPMPADRVVFLLRQLCHSLAEAHARGLLHRDIKPANMFVCRMGLDYDFVKVLDFGLVTAQQGLSDNQTNSLLTAAGTLLGTPAYIAPEVILGAGTGDASADVYAIGCVAYFMLTGHRVFEERSSMRALIDHVSAVPVPPSHRTELVIPGELEAVVMTCLDKDPAKRPADAGVLAAMLEGCPVDVPWSNTRAKEWWQTHLPDVVSRPTASPAAPTEV